MSKIKIAHIITQLELGGAQQNTLYCCGHHDPKKYEVILIAGVGGFLDDAVLKFAPNATTYFLPELVRPLRPFRDLLALFKMTRILKEEKIQLVHTHSSKAGILGRWAARMAGVPAVVHTIHGWGFYPGQFPPARWFYQVLERWAFRWTDRLIAVSRDNQDEGLAAGIGKPEAYQVIHSGIEAGKFRVSATRATRLRHEWGIGRRPCVLVLANFKAQKAPMDVVRIAIELKRSVPDFLLLWAGDGENRPKIEQALKKEGLQENVWLLGWRRDVPELLAVCDVLLLSSLHEGLPRSVLQAMAASRPVVATAVNGVPEAVVQGVTGYLHPPHDCEGMSQSLSKLLVNAKRAHRMGFAGRKALKGTFLIERMLTEIEYIYEKTLSQKGVPSPRSKGSFR